MPDAAVPDAAAPDATMPDALARIVDGPIDRAELEAFAATSADGAVVVFEGVIRDHDHGAQVRGLDYSAHPDALVFLQGICDRIAGESGLRVAVAHRIGRLEIGDVALVAVVASAHRREAFDTCSRLVDEIKAGTPIWKRQLLADGATEWVGL